MKRKSNYLVLALSISLMMISIMNADFKVNDITKTKDLDFIVPHASSTFNTSIVINDLPGYPQNWTWAKVQGICTSSGTENDPYIIKDHIFNTRGYFSNCLYIMNSRKYFRIDNCIFNASFNWAGIQLTNTTNGYITKNRNLPDTGALVWIYNSSYTIINNNNASYCHYYGILIDQLSHHNVITKNVASYNTEIGIHLRNNVDLNSIEDNIIYLNPTGISIYLSCDNNTVKENHISNSTTVGVFVDGAYCILYTNCFIDNAVHAYDDGNENVWDFSSKGNYWNNYTGADLNEDGIGDIPYNISGTAGSMDNFPLMKCPTPSNPSVIFGYELLVLISAMLIAMIGVVYLIYIKKELKF